MKYLIIIITTLLLLNCADSITKTNYITRDGTTSAWCSVDKWNSGTIKEIYTLDPIVEYDNQSTEIYVVAIDSVRGDSTFISNEHVSAVIVDQLFSDSYTIGTYNFMYDYDIKNDGYAEMYGSGEEFVECSE